MNELLTAKETAEYLGCARSYIKYLLLKGRLTPVATPLPRYYFRFDEVDHLKKVWEPKSK